MEQLSGLLARRDRQGEDRKLVEGYILGRPTLCSERTNKNALSAKDGAPALSGGTEKKKQGWATRQLLFLESS